MPTTVSDYRALLSGYSWWGGSTVGKSAFITFSFDTRSSEHVADAPYSNEFRASFQPLTPAQKAATLATLKAWGDASGIRFLEADPGQGDIRFGTYDFAKGPSNQGAAGYAYYPSVSLGAYPYESAVGGDVFLDDQVAGYSTADMTHVIAHEIGHALGLKHPFEGDVVLEPALDNTDNTVMSYTGYGPKLGRFDIAAIQHLYGLPSMDGKHVASWAWNAATDTLTQVGLGGADTLRGVASSDVMRGMAGNDILFGGRGRDLLDGGAGDDSLHGGDGDDTLEGGAGNDTLECGDGANVAAGGLGTDTINGGADRDRLDGGAGDDTLWGQGGADVLVGGLGNDSLNGGYGTAAAGDIDTADMSAATRAVVVSMRGTYELVGNTYVYYNAKGADVGYDRFSGIENVIGGAAGDVIDGDDLANVLDGRGGVDRMSGGAGNDTYYVDNIADLVTEVAGAGSDTVLASASYVLRAGVSVERLSVTGTRAVTLVGNEASQRIAGNESVNRLSGSGGNDVLSGLGGNDVLAGGAGRDTLAGGLGNDAFLFDTALNAATNVDTVTDFRNVAGDDDVIQLQNAVFATLTATGALAAALLKANATGTATDSNDRIVYETDTGKLFYDSNGNGAGGAVQFAVLTGRPALSAADFLVV